MQQHLFTFLVNCLNNSDYEDLLKELADMLLDAELLAKLDKEEINKLIGLSEYDISVLIGDLPINLLKQAFRLLPKDIASDVFAFGDDGLAQNQLGDNTELPEEVKDSVQEAADSWPEAAIEVE